MCRNGEFVCLHQWTLEKPLRTDCPRAFQCPPAAHSQTKESQIPSPFQWQPYPWALIIQQWEGLEPLLGPLESILHLWTTTGCTQVIFSGKGEIYQKVIYMDVRTCLSGAV